MVTKFITWTIGLVPRVTRGATSHENVHVHEERPPRFHTVETRVKWFQTLPSILFSLHIRTDSDKSIQAQANLTLCNKRTRDKRCIYATYVKHTSITGTVRGLVVGISYRAILISAIPGNPHPWLRPSLSLDLRLSVEPTEYFLLHRRIRCYFSSGYHGFCLNTLEVVWVIIWRWYI